MGDSLPKNGFTLVELLISFFLFVLLIFSFTEFYLFYKNTMQYLENKEKAVKIVFNLIEKIQSPDFIIKKDTLIEETPYIIKLEQVKISSTIDFNTYLISIYKDNKKLLQIYTWKDF